jgi:hypothetical protein
MFRVSRLLVAAALTLAVVGSASASSTLAPLLTVAGVVNTAGLSTYFACTNTDVVNVTIGIDVFGQAGGAPLVTAGSNAVSIASRATILFGTQTAAALTIDVVANPGTVTKGSADIETTSKKIACTAFLVDPGSNPPVSMTTLTIVRKGKQKGD